jgi:hypothetical protein
LSFLTKFFIVLHVVLTMLFVSAAVVFVNSVHASEQANKTLQANLAAAERREQEAIAALSTGRTAAENVRIQASNEIASMRRQFDKAQADIRARDAAVAMAQQNFASESARLQAATAALQTAQKTNEMLQQQLDQTRQASDKTQQQNTELLTANADLNSRLRTALRQLQLSNEELEQARTELADRSDQPGAARGQGGRGASAAAAAAVTTPAVPINGVVRDQKSINGVPYATVSVGSTDNVKPGMRFNVVDRDGGWLGYVTIDRVEPNESTGRLEGPRIADIRPGSTEVRTQL